MNKLIIAVLVSVSCSASAHAACFTSDPYSLPTNEIKVTLDETRERLYGFGESPQGMKPNAFPPPPPTELHNQDELKFSSTESLGIMYYEKSAKQTYRICRVDVWLPNRDTPSDPTSAEHTKRLAEHALSKRLSTTNRTLGFSTTYAYDSKGRVIRVDQADFTRGPKVTFEAQHCRRYDEKDRVLLWVNPSATHLCPKGEPSLKDEWREYRYGNHNGAEVETRSRWHLAKKDRWIERWTSFSIDASPDSVRGNASVDDRRGVWEISGSTYGKLDDNAANTVVDGLGHWNGSNYYFLNSTVSISILEKPDELYKYLRRRITNVDGRIRLVELFKPGEHVSQHRFYTFLGYVLRHEQLDDKGKIKRIITINNWRQPRPGSKPDFDDRRLAKVKRGLKLHQVYHRVYDIDKDGRPTLVALSWNRSVRNPLKATPLLQARLVFGTPDGKEKWKNRDEFDKAFDTSDDARQVFPDPPFEDDEE